MKRLFGADGIRGIVDRYPLQTEDAARIGSALATWLREKQIKPVVLIATDTRESCQRIKSPLVDGLNRSGVHVIDAQVLPTAAVSYLVAAKGCFDAGLMITASHNPIMENGLKIFDHTGRKLSDQQESEIETLFFDSRLLPWELLPASCKLAPEFLEQYVGGLVEEYNDTDWHKLRVMMDCAHGASYKSGPRVLSDLDMPHVILNASPDGTNINRQAGSEFIRQNPRDFSARLKIHEADIGFAVDGDADRVVLVDSTGKFYDGDYVLAMLATQLLHEGHFKTKKVAVTTMSNHGLAEYLGLLGLQCLTVQNGDKYITESMLANDLALGGEEIGHIVIRKDDIRITGDGLRTALELLSHMVKHNVRTLGELAPSMRKFPQINAAVYTGRLGVPPAHQIPGLNDLLQEVSDNIPDLTRSIECRPASTEPVYRIMLEAQETPVSRLADRARQIGQHIQVQLNCVGKPINVLDCVNGGRL